MEEEVEEVEVKVFSIRSTGCATSASDVGCLRLVSEEKEAEGVLEERRLTALLFLLPVVGLGGFRDPRDVNPHMFG